ncbi:hypothetical protein A0128_19040 [Leptospira tipperaryensis]|uniref:Uncharacterized protein n=1 Tax=Leptospira tipperaryensis TaxID=2564040 RepID=A0A1D7V1P5_9LEPT|nr:hypothetical protein A0128_19040 [Leptospira tipperaryensis]
MNDWFRHSIFFSRKVALSVVFSITLLSLIIFSVSVVQNPGYLDKNPGVESSESISESEIQSLEIIFVFFLVFSALTLSNSINILIVKTRELFLCDSGAFSVSNILRIEKLNIPPPYYFAT